MPYQRLTALPARTLRDYVGLYLQEEIRAEAAVRNLGGFVRFLPIAALLHAQTLSVSGIARDAGVARSTVTGYLEVLEDTLLASRLSAFEAGLRVRERRRPKQYWTDPGLVRAAKRLAAPLAPEERGALFAGWIFGLLRAYAEAKGIHDDIHYWSPAESRVGGWTSCCGATVNSWRSKRRPGSAITQACSAGCGPWKDSPA